MASHLPPPLNAGGGVAATARTTAIIIALTLLGHASRNALAGTAWATSSSACRWKEWTRQGPGGLLDDGRALGSFSRCHGGSRFRQSEGCRADLYPLHSAWLGHSSEVTSAPPALDERIEVGRADANRVHDAHVRELPAGAEAVGCRGGHAKPACDFGHREKRQALYPSWTQRLVLLRCGMGDSGIGVWYGPEWN